MGWEGHGSDRLYGYQIDRRSVVCISPHGFHLVFRRTQSSLPIHALVLVYDHELIAVIRPVYLNKYPVGKARDFSSADLLKGVSSAECTAFNDEHRAAFPSRAAIASRWREQRDG
jgi:hypothetical protein